MKCPYCANTQDRVVDSRISQNGSAIRRRRECTQCEKRFTTYEYIEESQTVVIKRDKRRENYNREKLITGVKVACKKRPVSIHTIDEIADRVEYRIRTEGTGEIDSLRIGKMVLQELQSVDQIAYIRFASVYLDVDTAEEFIRQIAIPEKN
ncbi:MAG: transcriptional regulator NrdR [Fibrobacterota bacterium]